MANADVMFTQAVRAYKNGQRDEARGILMEIVAEYEHHEQAWLLLSGLVETLDEQQICLENVVQINPNNDKALKGLDVVNRKIAARDGQPPPSPPAPPAAPTGPEFPPADDPFANAPWATPAQQQPDFGTQSNNVFDSWAPFNGDVPPADPFGSPASSVDWGSSDSQAAYGSGKQVELPSNQEYDDWVQGLNLAGGAGAAQNNPFPDEAPFGDTSFMLEEDTNNSFLANQPSSSTDPFGRNALFTEDSNVWEDDSSPFAEEPESGFSSSPPPFSSPELTFDSPPASAFGPAADFGSSNAFAPDAGSGPFVFDDQPSKSISFDFDAEDDDEDDLWPGSDDIAPTSIPVFTSKQQRAVNVQSEAYFRYIPNEIEPQAGGIEPRSLLMLAGIAALVILNLVSFGALLM